MSIRVPFIMSLRGETKERGYSKGIATWKDICPILNRLMSRRLNVMLEGARNGEGYLTKSKKRECQMLSPDPFYDYLGTDLLIHLIYMYP